MDIVVAAGAAYSPTLALHHPPAQFPPGVRVAIQMARPTMMPLPVGLRFEDHISVRPSNDRLGWKSLPGALIEAGTGGDQGELVFCRVEYQMCCSVSVLGGGYGRLE